MRNCSSSAFCKFILLFLPLCAAGQDLPQSVPSGSEPYLFPINPGQVNQLHGTMGELRNTHFHGGLDIRCNNQIGMPVRATQRGYISHIAVSPYSYGNAVYITHPDGHVSLYGHLHAFRGPIAKHILETQYARKSFDLDLDLPPGQFEVQRGDTIGVTGNTGASNGPHLHFEIREGNYQLNPLKFGFTEIPDDIAPHATRLALRTMDTQSRINDRFGRFEFGLVRTGPKEFVFAPPILAYGKIGIELMAEDRMNNSPGRCGVNYIEMYVDSQKVFSQHIERINMDESRGILTLMDYPTLETRGRRFNKLFVVDGNRLGFYDPDKNGIIAVNDRDRQVRITLRDEAGNVSNVRFTLRHNPIGKAMILATPGSLNVESTLFENILMISSPQCQGPETISLFVNGQEQKQDFDYRGANQRVYLINLKTVRPDSAITCAGTLRFHFRDVVPSNTDYTYYSDLADVFFPANALYDTLYLDVRKRVDNGKEWYKVGDRLVPLHRPIRVTLKPETDPNKGRKKHVYRREGQGYSFLGGEWDGRKVTFESSELGEFTFLSDSIAPSITRIRVDRNGARLRIRDNLSGISYYEAHVDGQWLLMAYDYKSGILQSEKLQPGVPLKGDFELKVVDRAGNERIFKQKIQ